MKPYDSAPDTNRHREVVKGFMDGLVLELAYRAEAHDKSKLEPEEKPIFDEFTPKLADSTYGSGEYKSFLREMGTALEHHYANNRHHPEHFVNGMRGMDLVDLVEMFCDWMAATLRHNDGDITNSIRQNMERFGYGETLAAILQNTAARFNLSSRIVSESPESA